MTTASLQLAAEATARTLRDACRSAKQDLLLARPQEAAAACQRALGWASSTPGLRAADAAARHHIAQLWVVYLAALSYTPSFRKTRDMIAAAEAAAGEDEEEVGRDDGAAAEGLRRAAAEELADVWTCVVAGYNGVPGEVDEDVVVACVALCLKQRVPAAARSVAELWLASLPESAVERIRASSASGTAEDTAARRDYERLVELYVLHVLPPLGDWSGARQFLAYNDLLPKDRLLLYQNVLDEMEKKHTERTEADSRRSKRRRARSAARARAPLAAEDPDPNLLLPELPQASRSDSGSAGGSRSPRPGTRKGLENVSAANRANGKSPSTCRKSANPALRPSRPRSLAELAKAFLHTCRNAACGEVASTALGVFVLGLLLLVLLRKPAGRNVLARIWIKLVETARMGFSGV